MRLSNICPNCERYIFKYGDGEGKFRYPVKKVYRSIWEKTYGNYPLGRFYKSRCPVCKRNLVVFEDLHDEELKEHGPIVLYLCTLGDRPFDVNCAQHISCNTCGILKKQREAEETLWYKTKK